MALDSFRRIVIEIDTANDYIAPIILSRGDVNGRTLVVKLTDNGKPVTNTDGLVVKLAYRSAGQTSGWVKTMTKVGGYDTAAWSCSAPGSVLSSEYAIMCIQICQGSDVVCSRTFRAAVDKPIINLSPGTDEGDAVKALQEILASLDDQQAKFDAAEKKREQDFKSAATSASTAAEKANSAATGANAAKEAADTAAKKANTAGDDAVAAKAKADSAASKANAAATKAEAAASSANSAADGLADIKKLASDAATKANGAADRVDASIESANTAAAAANKAASSVKAAGSLAGSAAAKADDAAAKALSASTSANSAANSALSAAGAAGSAASTAGSAAEEAKNAAHDADVSAAKADTATGKANEATVAATNAATKANEIESKLTGNVLKGKIKDTFIHVDDAFPSSLLGIEIEGATAQGSTTGANLFDIRKFIPNHSAYGLTVCVEDGYVCISGTVSGVGDIQDPSFSIGQYAESSLSGKQLNLKIFGAPSFLKKAYGLRTVDETQIAVVASIHDGDTINCKFLLAVSVNTLTEYEPYTGGKPSPSAEYPQQLNNLSKAELKVAGKNLADVDESDNINFILHKEPLPAGTYTFSCDKGLSSGFRFNVKPIDGSGKVVEKDIAGSTVSPCTITLSEPMGLYVNGWGLTGSYNIGSIQLEAGSKATDFEPVSKPKATQIDLKGNDICSLTENVVWQPKTYKDELEIDSEGNVSLIKRVFSARIDGSERVRAGNADKFQYFSYQPKTVLPLDGSSAIRSNRFGKVGREPWSFYVAGGSDAAFFFVFPLETFANDSELNEWLSKNPIDVNYLGAETKTIPLGKIELPALPESVSNVWTDAEVTPRTTIEYTKDVNIAIARIEDAIASIG